MPQNSINKISFQLKTMSALGVTESHRQRIQYFINDVNFLSLIDVDFKDFLGIPEFCKEALVGSKSHQEDNGKTMILVCSCGEAGCGSLACRITEQNDHIIWNEFEEVWGENEQYPNIGPFVFDKAQYYEAYSALMAK